MLRYILWRHPQNVTGQDRNEVNASFLLNPKSHSCERNISSQFQNIILYFFIFFNSSVAHAHQLMSHADGFSIPNYDFYHTKFIGQCN